MNYSEYAKKIKGLQSLQDPVATKEARRLALVMNAYISQKFVLRFNLRLLDCDLIQQACSWTLECPKCRESVNLYGHGRITLKGGTIYCESYQCQICRRVFSSKPFGWLSKNATSEPVLIFPVKNSNGTSEEWTFFLESYLYEWKHSTSIYKQGVISNVSRQTELCRKTVRQWEALFKDCIHWLCTITNNGFNLDTFLYTVQKEDIPFLIWILYLYSYGYKPVR